MNFQLSNTADDVLLHQLAQLAARDRATTAALVAHIAEVDRRRLYAGKGCSSMFWYCVRHLRMSEDVTCKQLRVARAARNHPALLPAIETGELSLATAVLLAPHLNRENAAELLAAARLKTRRQVERLLAQRFPQADLPAMLVPLVPVTHSRTAASAEPELSSAPGRIEVRELSGPPPAPTFSAPEIPAFPRVVALSAVSYGVQFTASVAAHERLRYAQALLGHAVPSGDLAQVYERAIEALIAQLEREKFAKTSRTRASRGSDDPRYVPAAVKRAVVERDQGRCTFVAPDHRRCDARTRLEFDHVTPVARGGEATVENVRLRCRAHNQLEAERAFGAGFVNAKREQAKVAGRATLRNLAPASARTIAPPSCGAP